MDTSREIVKIGLIGCGARLRGVVQPLISAADNRIRVTAVYDPDPLSLAAAAADFGPGLETCASETELMKHPALDWIFVGSHNAYHASQSINALRAGKNVFCEKPLATSPEDCLAVEDAVRETGRVFAFGLVLRYSPHYQRIRELVRSGVLGEPISLEFNETLSFNHGGYIFGNWRRHRAEAGTHLLEKCCHDLDLANWIVNSRPRFAASFGGRDFFVPGNEKHTARIGPDAAGRPAYQTWPDPRRVNPFSKGADIADNQVAILEYENGVKATFHTNCNAGIPERRFYLCGTEGALRADACAGKIEWQRIGHEPRLQTIDTKSSDSHAGGDAVMSRSLIQTLLHGEPPLATVEDGVLASLTAFLIDEAMDARSVAAWADCFPPQKTNDDDVTAMTAEREPCAHGSPALSR